MTPQELTDNQIIYWLLIGGAIGFIIASIIWGAAVMDFRDRRRSLTNSKGGLRIKADGY